jgi:hypothetical protein
MFSETFAVGFPPKPYALAAYLALLEEVADRAPWMIAGFAANVAPLIAETVARGGHVRVGLEDAPLRSEKSNVSWVEDAVRLVRQHGGEPASKEEVVRNCGSPPTAPEPGLNPYSGSSSLPVRSRLGVAISPSSKSSSSDGGGGGFFGLSSAFFGGSLFLPVLPIAFP